VSLEVRIEGAATFKRVAAQMRAEGRKDLSRAMGAALTAASIPVQEAVTDEAGAVMPSRGGYRDLLTGSLKHRLTRRLGGQSARLILTTYAEGTKERRDIVALNKGTLRHPVYGRSRRIKRGKRAGTSIPNPWAVTKIRSGFYDRGTAQAMELVQAAMVGVIEDYAARLAGN
jgi:hypothetical protein